MDYLPPKGRERCKVKALMTMGQWDCHSPSKGSEPGVTGSAVAENLHCLGRSDAETPRQCLGFCLSICFLGPLKWNQLYLQCLAALLTAPAPYLPDTVLLFTAAPCLHSQFPFSSLTPVHDLSHKSMVALHHHTEMFHRESTAKL